jgi:hypothetical protein
VFDQSAAARSAELTAELLILLPSIKLDDGSYRPWRFFGKTKHQTVGEHKETDQKKNPVKGNEMEDSVATFFPYTYTHFFSVAFTLLYYGLRGSP